MKPGFALSLSPDGISLLHRAAGGWRLVGSVELDTSDLGSALANLRAKAEQLDPGPIFCKLIVPNRQIRYLTLETGLVDDGVRMDMARAALDGATPYPVDELAFDLSQDGPLTHVAAVAIETLDEAESFAVSHGFGPTSFVAAPGDESFLGEPFFGTARSIRGTDVDPDGIAVVNIGPASIPPAPSDTKPTSPVDLEPDTSHDEPNRRNQETAVQQVAVDQIDQSSLSDKHSIPVPSFSSRRQKPANGAPVLQGASRIPTATDSPNSTIDPTPPQASGFEPSQPEVMPISAQKAEPAALPQKNSSESPSPKAPTQVSAPSVTGPDEDPAAAAAISTTNNNAFSSRRQTASTQGTSSHTPQAAGHAAAAPKSATPGNSRNNPFGTREPPDIGGKPRFLGPLLIAILLLFMAAVAAWAVYSKTAWFSFGQNNNAETTKTAPSPIEGTVEPKLPDPTPIPPVPAVESTPDQLPEILQPQVSALPESLTEWATTPDQDDIHAPGLTGTDIAVLDALREPARTDLDVEAISDGVDEIQTTTPRADLSQAAQYAASGIWQSVPKIPDLPAVIGLDGLYVASIDNTDLSQDAVALPLASDFATDHPLDSVISPATAGSAFDLDERGLVRATPEGTMNPDGVMVFSGRPSRVPPPTPNRPDPEAEAQISEQQAVLARLRPRARPDDLVEQTERAQLGGLSLAELGQKRPRPRPASSRPANEDSLPTTEQAIATSVVPRSRPVNFANLVDRAQRNTTAPASAAASTAGILNQPAAVAPATVTPSIPTTASVARQATMENSINLRKVNLIGVYGTPSNRRALVRLSSGRYKKVKVGDKIDGGQVVAIGDAELRYQKGGRNVVLKIPNG